MNRNNQDSLTLRELLCQVDARNPRNVALAGLGIRTSMDVFEAAQKQYEEARNDKQFARQWSQSQGGVPSRAVDATIEEDVAQEGHVVESTIRPLQQKRKHVGSTDRGQPKHARTVDTTEPQWPQCARTVGTTD